MLPIEVLGSSEIIDLPSNFLYTTLTPDQQRYFLNLKKFWTEIYAALTRYHSGLPIVDSCWQKQDKDLFTAYVSLFLALYSAVNFGWNELTTRLENCPESPGKLFLVLLKNRANAQMIPCLEQMSFSPQIAHRRRRDAMKGQGETSATPSQLNAMATEQIVWAILEKSGDQQVRQAGLQ
ncbi:MAG: hypothetical protein KME35_22925 [Aphanocapsa sp. GSE-SYN-MK-11-07L]|jgi:hypothetical protein|nr:hypothetical protein [Aphanocapsa sp. GSE-SYN-MK-11-07L]